MRGGFRYLNLILQTNGTVDVAGVTVHFTAAPNMPDPSAWKNHFYSSDDLLNRVWYGAGYTTQLCSIAPGHGRQGPPPASGWNNSASCGIGDVVLVDGAKRDRMIWPGDMGVSVGTAFATTGDVDASRNALDTLFSYQDPSGMLPYVGPPIAAEKAPGQEGGSDTYHLWAIIGTCDVAGYTLAAKAPAGWAAQRWAGLTKAVNASVAKITASDLMTVTATADWARGGQGGENVAANSLLYQALTCTAALGRRGVGGAAGQALAVNYEATAAKLQAAINRDLWDDAKGAFRDNTKNGCTLYPQDGNSVAVWFNVTTSSAQARRVSDYLKTNWNAFGSTSPEWNGDIGTFPGSMEVHAHMAAGEAERAHDLIRLQWGYMLHKPESTQSTFWEVRRGGGVSGGEGGVLYVEWCCFSFSLSLSLSLSL
jgi:hypothetical protein